MRKRSSNFDFPTALSPSTMIFRHSLDLELPVDVDDSDTDSLIWNKRREVIDPSCFRTSSSSRYRVRRCICYRWTLRWKTFVNQCDSMIYELLCTANAITLRRFFSFNVLISSQFFFSWRSKTLVCQPLFLHPRSNMSLRVMSLSYCHCDGYEWERWVLRSPWD